MSLGKRIVGFSLFIVLLTQGAVISFGQEPSASPSPTPEETPAPSDDARRAPFESAFERLEWRSIGPANMGGRTADIESVSGNANLVYVATASGGLWKTVNGGVTFGDGVYKSTDGPLGC
jgi:hypothetical protein